MEKKQIPSMDEWMKEAKISSDAGNVGMYLIHNGVVRETARSLVRDGDEKSKTVIGMLFSHDKEKLAQAVEEARNREGIFYVRVWLNEGNLKTGEDLMYVLIGGDIRPRVVDTLDFLVGKIKAECVSEIEIYE